MITTRAPGKLFVAGEYAVVEPGQPSVLVAVDRFLTVSVDQSDAFGQVHSEAYGQLPITWTRDATGVRIDRKTPYDYVLATITLVDRLRAELGRRDSFFDLRIASELDDRGGRKFGLGSSAAVTVATVAALDEFFELRLTAMERFRLAMLATVSVVPTASGGDLAASTFGGWIGYSSPDRAALVRRLRESRSIGELLAEPWEGLSVTRIEPPASARLLVGWTGAPASTERLVDRVLVMRGAGSQVHRDFLAASRDQVSLLTGALQADDVPTALDAIRSCRLLLRELGAAAGIDIETDRLRRLCDAAERAGAAAKPSGAGGGDCGIALAPPDADVQGMHRAWEADDVRHLTLSVTPPRSDVDG
ncbi:MULTISPECIES: phosphomevalonate kinase [unclassified Agrococcus]|uniref:phosphomevalonate kinase n=1 Tax=unclassified Agrococcus TaxID=2615065 RepID=UPI00360BE6F5